MVLQSKISICFFAHQSRLINSITFWKWLAENLSISKFGYCCIQMVIFCTLFEEMFSVFFSVHVDCFEDNYLDLSQSFITQEEEKKWKKNRKHNSNRYNCIQQVNGVMKRLVSIRFVNKSNAGGMMKSATHICWLHAPRSNVQVMRQLCIDMQQPKTK